MPATRPVRGLRYGRPQHISSSARTYISARRCDGAAFE